MASTCLAGAIGGKLHNPR